MTYYVDSAAGNDSAAGTSTATAWKSLAKVNGFALQPGDQVLFKRGASWTGTLGLSRSGASDAPIVIGAYGSGALPMVGGPVLNCVNVTGSDIFIGNLRASGCNWAGFELVGDSIVMDTVQADANVVGVSIVDGSDWNTIRWSTIVDTNKMSVLTPKEVNPDDDSGAFGFLVPEAAQQHRQGRQEGRYDDSFDTGDPADAADEDRGVYQGSVYQFTLGARSVKADPSTPAPPTSASRPTAPPSPAAKTLAMTSPWPGKTSPPPPTGTPAPTSTDRLDGWGPACRRPSRVVPGGVVHRRTTRAQPAATKRIHLVVEPPLAPWETLTHPQDFSELSGMDSTLDRLYPVTAVS